MTAQVKMPSVSVTSDLVPPALPQPDSAAAPLPEAWAQMLTALRRARLEAEVMRLPGLPGPARDLALQRYVTSVDRVIACLGELSDSGKLSVMAQALAA